MDRTNLSPVTMTISEHNYNFIATALLDEQLLSLCIDLFMAGSETTSNTLSFAILYMLAYPDVQKRVQAEMDEVVGRHRWPSMQDKVKYVSTLTA